MDKKFTINQLPVVCYERAHSSNTGLEAGNEVSEIQSANNFSEDDENNKLTHEGLNLGCSESQTAKPGSRMPLMKLWFVLILTLGFTVVLLVASHLTHSLTLRVEAYHALYNLMALGGCLFTIKVCNRPASIKNTFGWARFELLTCLCTLLFIGSLCFSVALESVQIAAHAGHQDPMHHPLYIIALGGIGLLVNFIVFCLIGGYTHHQGCFLERRNSGVWVQSRVSEDAVQAGMRALLSSPIDQQSSPGRSLNRSYQGLRGIIRDICGLVVLVLCASVVLWDTQAKLALYIDPAFAMISASILLFLSYPFGKECCQILLQTIPGNIDVQTLSAKILEEFPEIVNVHHLHIWSLTPGKVIATAHVVYTNPQVFRRSVQALEQFFIDEDITQVTLQPEFVHYASTLPSGVGSNDCLLRCTNHLCHQKECCDGCQTIIPEEIHLELEEHPDEFPSVSNIHQCPTSSIRKPSLLSEHHGTSAFRVSLMDLSVRASLYGKSKSKDDLLKNTRERSNMYRSTSCNVVLEERRELLKDSADEKT